MSAVEPLAPAADIGGPGQPLLQVRGLSKQFPVRGGLRTRAGVVRAVDGVSFTVNKREVMGGCRRVRLRQIDDGAPCDRPHRAGQG
jgi:peptide/nickel transport system ATP-binding protein